MLCFVCALSVKYHARRSCEVTNEELEQRDGYPQGPPKKEYHITASLRYARPNGAKFKNSNLITFKDNDHIQRSHFAFKT